MSSVMISMTSDTGDTLYAFPDGQSLDSWTTYRVALTAGTGDDANRYSGIADFSLSTTNRYLAFRGASEPASYDNWIWAWDLGKESAYVPLYSLPYIHIIGS